MAYGWEGERVRLVPLDEARHLANALAWLNDPQVTEWTLIGDTPITRLGEEAYFRRMSEGTTPGIAPRRARGAPTSGIARSNDWV